MFRIIVVIGVVYIFLNVYIQHNTGIFQHNTKESVVNQ